MGVVQILVILTISHHCCGRGVLDKFGHTQRLIQRRDDSPEVHKIMRRSFNPGEPSVMLGAPSYSYHLPPAEPILPGHTLIRPAIGMLKSSVKFPHREQENGSGVYGYYENLGIKFNGKNDRVLYTGFRRMLPNSQYSETRRSTSGDPNLYKKRYLEMYPAVQRDQPNFKTSSDEVLANSELPFIYRALQKHNKGRHVNPAYHQWLKENFMYSKEPSISLSELRIFFNKGIVILLPKRKNEIDLRDVFRLIKSLRRDQELDSQTKSAKLIEIFDTENVEDKLLYVPGKAHYGDFGGTDSEPDGTSSNKTIAFWKTKNTFNHIKISPDAPEQTELIPSEAADKPRDWWFFHQSDFEDFEGSS